MLLVPTSKIDESYLASLVRDRCPESDTLEFKSEPPGSSDNDKREFMKDVCAMANASGGDIIYGIEEQDGSASALKPITSEAPDAMRRRLSQVLDTIDPRITGIEIAPISLSVGHALVIRVPTSFDAPHSVRNGTWRRYVTRSGSSTSDLTMDQLRAAFGRTAALTDQARTFLERRITTVLTGGAWRPLVRSPIAGVYVVPLAAIAGKLSINFTDLYNSYTRFLFEMHAWGSGMSRTVNLDGLIVHPGDISREIAGYRLAHRCGAMEAIQVVGGDVDGRMTIPPIPTTRTYLEMTRQLIQIAADLGASGPGIIKCVLFNALGAEFSLGSQWRYEKNMGDRSLMDLPELWVDDIATPGEIDVLMRPSIDVLWQAFGHERCTAYDDEGRFSPTSRLR